MQRFPNCEWFPGESQVANIEALFENQGNPWEQNIKWAAQEGVLSAWEINKHQPALSFVLEGKPSIRKSS